MRSSFQLTAQEKRVFWKLRPIQGEALQFWSKVAFHRGLDPTTLITDGRSGSFTGLSIGHGKHWCWPISLKCKKKSVYKD